MRNILYLSLFLKSNLNLEALVMSSAKFCFTPAEITRCRENLLEWYQQNRRRMPWRGDPFDGVPVSLNRPTAYGTWVSEIMLQQTQVSTVIPYWIKWMQRYPTVADLAIASTEEVNSLWAGLGYYRRAQLLLKGASSVMEKYNGEIPSTVEDLLKIPGIGPYTAGAIASIAFNIPAPLVDGNVIRVLTRLRAMDLVVTTSEAERVLWALADELVDPEKPGNFNQALMELGATVCKPTSPTCNLCPVSSICRAYQQQGSKSSLSSVDAVDIEDLEKRDVCFYPVKEARKKPKELVYAVFVLRITSGGEMGSGEDEYLFVRRPDKGLLANQWEFPTKLLWQENARTANDDLTAAVEGVKTFNEDEISASFKEFLDVDFPVIVGRFSSSSVISAKTTLLTGLVQSVLSLEKTIVSSASVLLGSARDESFRLYAPPIAHVFSHQRHTMYVAEKVIHIPNRAALSSEDGPSSPAGTTKRPISWMTAVDISEAGITTGCKKILQRVSNSVASVAGQSRSSSSSNETKRSGLVPADNGAEVEKRAGGAKELSKRATTVAKRSTTQAKGQQSLTKFFTSSNDKAPSASASEKAAMLPARRDIVEVLSSPSEVNIVEHTSPSSSKRRKTAVKRYEDNPQTL